jgi:exoribonuclease II
LHLPEGTIHLLPRALTLRLGLGLQDISPALSFGMDLDESGGVIGFEIVPTWVRVSRPTYEEVEFQMDQEPFCTIARMMELVRERRRQNGAVLIDFPEVKLWLEGDQVLLRPFLPLRSRSMVEEAMILASSEVARFAVKHQLRLPFSQQEAMETQERPVSLAEMFAFRRLLKRSRFQSVPGPHSGLGVAAYAQSTSPLRRYLDLVTHRQLRAFLKGKPTLDEAALVEQIGAVEVAVRSIRQAEILSEKHWILVYLLQNADWRGEGILVDKRGATGIVLIPSLGLETRVHLSQDVPLNQTVRLRVGSINLAQLDVNFRVE